VLDERLRKHRRYCIDVLLPFILVYLSELKSYELTVWYPLEPSTLWRWMNWLCQRSSQCLRDVQRRLVESFVPLMAQAKLAGRCPNADKARIVVMREGLNNLRVMFDLADQFLDRAILARVILPEASDQRYPPQSSQCKLF